MTALFHEKQPADAAMATKLNILQHGLQKPAERKKILILGAGMAGLTAGYLLKNRGHNVELLEASPRVGGRVYTMRAPFSEGRYFEAGAMRIPSNHLLTKALISQFNLLEHAFTGGHDNDLLYINGRLVRRYQYERRPDILRFPLPAHEQNQTAEELLKKALRPFVELLHNAGVREKQTLIKTADRFSLTSFLRENPWGEELSAEAVHKINVVLGIQGVSDQSFIDCYENLIRPIFLENVTFSAVRGGNSRLPEAMGAFLADNMQLDKTVVQIEQLSDHIGVTAKNNAQNKLEYFTADQIICTLPFSVLQFVNILPHDSVSQAKWQVIRTLHYVSAVKVGAAFTEPFWEKENLQGAQFFTDMPSQFGLYPQRANEGNGGVLLASYSWGDKAELWDAYPETGQVNNALRFLSRIHGIRIYKLMAERAAFSWSNNPYSAGGFSLYSAYQAARYPAIIKSPEGRIHFAGEHTSHIHGWIEGAVESGIRTAMEVNQ